MRSHFNYIKPNNLEHALRNLNEHAGDATVIAGGTDLMIKIRSGELSKKHVLDISRLDELRQVKRLDDSLRIGSALSFSEIIANENIRKYAPTLVEAAAAVGSPQIRNVGTIGGNIANASPAADSFPALMVHNARVTVKSADKTRVEPLNSIVVAPYKTTLRPNELITDVTIENMPRGYKHSFQRIARRNSLSIARINGAAFGVLDEEGLIKEVRISAGSITPGPSRQITAEESLLGARPTLAAFVAAAELIAGDMVRQSGVRSSTEYKEPAVQGLTIKLLMDVFLNA